VAASRDKPANASPRLVIADISGPERAVKIVKALRSMYAAPIVALSARFRRGLGGSVDAAQQLGVRNVLPKPFTREELLSAVEQAIGAPDAT
jgi:CheY-like chemotaxis protein